MWHMFLLLALLPAQGKNEGEQLFRQMEEKLAKAKTLDLSFEISMGPGKKFEGSLLSMIGNKARLELNGQLEGKAAKILMVSDGTRVTFPGNSLPLVEGAQLEPPKRLDEMIRAMVTRAGVILPLFMEERVEAGRKPKEFKPDEQMGVSEFRLGKAEKLGERDARLVEYKLTLKSAKEPFSVTLWVDAKTSLSLKRVLSGKLWDQRITVTETYTRMALDGKLDEKKFVLPK